MPTNRQKRPARPPAAARSAGQSLAQAFASFTNAAGALEISYAQLQVEVAGLRGELEQTNRDLARSLDENQRMRHYLRRILEGLPCGVLVCDPGGHPHMANPEARRLLGIESDTSLQNPLLEPQAVGRLLAEVPLESPGAEQAWSVESPEGPRYVGVTRALLADGQDSRADSIFILRDTTAEKHLEKEREVARRMQALAEMATLLAHEIRNPLGSLELFAGLLADATDNKGEIRHWIDHLQAGLRTLSATVNNVLQFHGHPPLQLVSINVLRLLRETVEFLQPLARQRGMRIDWVELPGQLSIRSDPQRLRQVFLNLALNAFRSMSPGGCLKIRAIGAEPGPAGQVQPVGQVQIDFKDQGAGMAPESLKRIFEPGFTTNPGSPGLGLTVCRKIVEQHGGTIRARSIPGRGSTLTLGFPSVREAR